MSVLLRLVRTCCSGEQCRLTSYVRCARPVPLAIEQARAGMDVNGLSRGLSKALAVVVLFSVLAATFSPPQVSPAAAP